MMMSQARLSSMVDSSNPGHQYNDTTFTKIFVGGLAWETQRDTMRRYFEQFGQIVEAVVITDKNTGRSKGYGFVTFKDPEAAVRACLNPTPVIDGRRANCNLASLGANKTHPPTPQPGVGRFRAATGLVAPSAYQGGSSFIHQSAGDCSLPYSAYGYMDRYSGYSQDNTMFPMNYYSFYGGGGQQFLPYSTSIGASGQPGMIPCFYPYNVQHAQTNQTHGYGIQYPQMMQFLFVPPHYGSAGILSLPSSMAMPASIPGEIATATTSASASATVTTAVAASGAGGVELKCLQPSSCHEQASSN